MIRSKNRRVVVTGVGPLSAIGIGKDNTWKNLLDKKINLVSMDKYIFGKFSEKFFMHKIKEFDISNFCLNPDFLYEMKVWKSGEEVIDLYYLLAAVKLALEDSQILYKGKKDIGMVLTHENPGIEQFCSNIIKTTFKMLKNKKNFDKEWYFRYLAFSFNKNVNDLQTFMFLFFVARMFGIHGYSLFVNNSCASGLYAIETASQMIREGINRAVIVASSEHPGIYKYLWFQKLGFLAKDGKIKPFSMDRDGFVCGEGGAALILEDLESAKKRNAHIYAEYIGGGFFLESWKVTLPKIKGNNFYKKAILQSLQEANKKPKDIDLISAHGLGSQVLDAYEAMSLTSIFGKRFERPFVSAFKPFIGHTLGNCALLETIILLLCLENDLIVPVLNSDNIDSSLNLKVVKELTQARLKTVQKTVWGFGGYNASVIFQKMK